jgi:hypothetical protein
MMVKIASPGLPLVPVVFPEFVAVIFVGVIAFVALFLGAPNSPAAMASS